MIEGFAGKRVLVLGLGREGLASVRYLHDSGAQMTIGVADRLSADALDAATREVLEGCGIEARYLGPDYLGVLSDYDVIVRAPGIPPWTPAIEAAVARGAVLTSNTKLFFATAPGTVIGVTGTKGKSTTTSLIHHVLQQTGRDVRLGGNIGIAPTELLAGAVDDTVFVLELSCHQLLDLEQSPQIAVVQDVVPEHLDYYRSFEEYVRAKQSIVLHQRAEDVIVYNRDGAVPRAFAASTPAEGLSFSLDAPGKGACFLRDDTIVLRERTLETPVIAASDVPLVGRFNLLNVMPATIIGRRFGLAPEVIREAVMSFRSLQHRLELVGGVDGVRYYNDSLATVPEATIGAIEAFAPARIVLIAGGFDRGQDYNDLAKTVRRGGVGGLVLLPETGARLWQAVVECDGTSPLPEHREVSSMDEAVAAARDLTRPGDVVLMSPAAASFGVFKDYADRGERFRAAVEHLGR